MQGLAVLCVILISVHSVNAACFAAKPESVKTLTGSKLVCPYKINRTTLKFEVGSDFTLDCTRCTCSEDGLHCCGIGFYAGLMFAEPGCKAVPDGCNALLIKEGANRKQDYKDCFTEKYIFPRK